MDRDYHRRLDERRGGESYRPGGRSANRSSLGYWARSPPRNRSPRLVADTWAPSSGRAYPSRPLRSRSPPPVRRRSRSPPFSRYEAYERRVTPRRLSPIRDGRGRSPPKRSRSPYGDAPPGSRRKIQGPQSPRGDLRQGKEPYAPHMSSKHPKALLPSKRDMTSEFGPLLQSGDSVIQDGPPLTSAQRRRSPSVPAPASFTQVSAQNSCSHSRYSSPVAHLNRGPATPSDHRHRSPISEPKPHQRLRSLERKSSTGSEMLMQKDRWYDDRTAAPGKRDVDSIGHALPRFGADQHARDFASSTHEANNISSQPKSYSNPQRNITDVHNSPLSSHRRDSRLSLLSAPTGPRGKRARDYPSTGNLDRRLSTPITPRRPIFRPAANPGPVGPRSEAHQRFDARYSATTPTLDSPNTQKPLNHLAGLCAVIPGGKLIPFPLDAAMAKRLAQLEADREKLFEQAARTQRSKRLLIMDWDKLDRESSICNLKSELAEGHLQYVTDGESMRAGIAF